VPNDPRMIVTQNGDFVCQISEENTQNTANATLLAAVPELFTTVEKYIGYLEIECGARGIDTESFPDCVAARKLLRKIGGEE